MERETYVRKSVKTDKIWWKNKDNAQRRRSMQENKESEKPTSGANSKRIPRTYISFPINFILFLPLLAPIYPPHAHS